jgi:broad specificity phosphatase PhoE
MELQWGTKIIEAIKQLDGQENTIVLVRHSERRSFDGMPVEKWNSVLLTERGIEAAKQFGKAVTTDAAVKDLRVHHWGLKRCVMTADAISQGAIEAGSNVSGPTAIQLKSPIVVQKEYQKEIGSVRWEKFVDEWLRASGPQFGMMSSDQYAKEILRELRNEKKSSPSGATIIATHDLHIIPLIKYVFHETQPWIDFLDGIAVKVNHNSMAVSYAGKIQNLRSDELE